jgi:7-cyano-7-deazaguanine synthase
MSDLLLLSGGIDSAAIAAWFRPTVCLTIDYGQRAAKAEITAAAEICRELQLHHVVKQIDLGNLGSGEMATGSPSPHSPSSEFWPFRNQFLITVAAMAALQEGCDRILIGTVKTDVRHRDGTAEFLAAINNVLMCQEGSIRVLAPGADFTTLELIELSNVLPATLGWCHSCHTKVFACGQCRGCIKHSEIMEALGLVR